MQGKERERILAILAKTPNKPHNDPNFYHGRLKHYPQNSTPKTTWKSTHPPRMGITPWLTASELCDKPQILADKMQYLTRLLLCSKKTVVYSGAGISTSSGVHQTAWGKTGRSKSLGYQTDAEPNLTHFALTALVKHNLVHEWIQLNYDGLSQKAGCPQAIINEVHGSWYDPSNPVVKPKGTIREDLFERMLSEADSSDLTLVLGTSLRGTSCDIVAQGPAERSLTGGALGTVIISIQQTKMDGGATLRIFSDIERAMKMLLKSLELNFTIPKLSLKVINYARVPYDKDGQKSETKTTCLNLTPGQKVKLNSNHNCQGSMQPGKLHILGGESIVETERQKTSGVGRVMRYSSAQMAWEIEGVKMLLGCWWMESAIKGLVKTLPIINTETQEQEVEKEQTKRVGVAEVKT